MLGGRGGLRLYFPENILIYDNHVERTQSDGIHVVHESKNVIVANNRVENSGDDCISVVNYSGPDQDPNRKSVDNILVEGNDCWGSRARGLTVIGGNRVTHRGNHIKNVSLNGVLLFPSKKHSSADTSRVLVTQNLIENCHLVQVDKEPYSGGVGLMGHDGNLVRDSVLYKNVIKDTRGAAFAQIHLKYANYIKNVTFDGNIISGTKQVWSGKTTANGISYVNNQELGNKAPVIDYSKYGSTLPANGLR
jgi:hypothetical protein